MSALSLAKWIVTLCRKYFKAKSAPLFSAALIYVRRDKTKTNTNNLGQRPQKAPLCYFTTGMHNLSAARTGRLTAVFGIFVFLCLHVRGVANGSWLDLARISPGDTRLNLTKYCQVLLMKIINLICQRW